MAPQARGQTGPAWARSPLFLDSTQASATIHPLDCIKQQKAIFFGHAAEQPSQFQIKLSILHRLRG